MPVRKRPEPPKDSNRKLEKFIAAPETKPADDTDIVSVKLRVPADLLNDIDSLVASAKPKRSRHQWLLEALYEKVERESE